MRLDSHQHFWVYDPVQYPWMTEGLKAIRRNFLPADLALELSKVGIDASIAVQARQTIEESRWLLSLAETDPAVRGVVGWVDLRMASVDEQLGELASHSKFVGVRHVVQDEPDDRFMLGEEFLRGIGALAGYGLTYDLLVFPRQLPAAIEVVRRFPEQPFVLDHMAKPLIKEGIVSPWAEQIRELARSGNVHCKLSGMVTEAKWGEWAEADFKPFLDVVFEAFGEDRLMFGSDWPVCRLAGSYEEVYGIVDGYLAGAGETARNRIFGENAARFYGVQE